MSPIIRTGQNGSYDNAFAMVNSFYKFMNYHGCKLQSDFSCSMHVHVSPIPGRTWTPELVKRVGCAAYFWERAVRALLPVDRQRTGYAKDLSSAKRSFLFPKPSPRTWTQLFDAVGPEEHNQAVYAVNMTPSDMQENLRSIMDYKCTMMNIQELVYDKLSPDKYGGWNFNYVKKFNGATIEFRKPPPADTVETAMTWVNFTAAFVLAATRRGTPEELAKYDPTSIESLSAFLRDARPKFTKPSMKDPLDDLLNWSVHMKPQLLNAEQAEGYARLMRPSPWEAWQQDAGSIDSAVKQSHQAGRTEAIRQTDEQIEVIQTQIREAARRDRQQRLAQQQRIEMDAAFDAMLADFSEIDTTAAAQQYNYDMDAEQNGLIPPESQ